MLVTSSYFFFFFLAWVAPKAAEIDKICPWHTPPPFLSHLYKAFLSLLSLLCWKAQRMWVEVIFSLCVWLEGSKPSFPIVLLSPVRRGPHQSGEYSGQEQARASAEGGICTTVPPLWKSIKFLACRTTLNGAGWDFYFLLPLPKSFASFWHGDKMQPSPSINTIKPSPDQTSLGAIMDSCKVPGPCWCWGILCTDVELWVILDTVACFDLSF